jgi:hypothetical protein
MTVVAVHFPLATADQPSDNNLCPPRHCKFRGASYDGYHSKEARADEREN